MSNNSYQWTNWFAEYMKQQMDLQDRQLEAQRDRYRVEDDRWNRLYQDQLGMQRRSEYAINPFYNALSGLASTGYQMGRLGKQFTWDGTADSPGFLKRWFGKSSE